MTHFLGLIRSNWKSGLTVALVSIPMSVSLAVASGTTPTVGIITAVWAGLIAAIFGSSNYNIVGPAGALTGILAAFAFTQGAAVLPMLAIISGIFILIAWACKLEKYLVFIPASTVHGFTLGVALILCFGQLNFALGLENLTKHKEFIENVFETFKNVGALHWPTFTVFALFLIGLFILLKYTPKLPAVIALTPIGILLGFFSARDFLPFNIITLGEKFPTISPALAVMPTFTINTDIIIAAVTVAAVAILETMLCGKVADGMTGTKHNRQKEMFGLGLANLASGFAGGLPATAVLARTALNAKSQASHRMSQGLNAVFIITISFLFLSSFKFIPLAVVAAILIFTSYRMIEQHHFIRMFIHEKKSFFISILVGFVTVYFDPIVGIFLGTAIALLLFVEKLSRGQFEIIANDLDQKKILDRMHDDKVRALPKDCDTLVYSVNGQLAYINALAHVTRFEKMDSHYDNVILRLRELYFIDLDGVDAFDEIITLIKKAGKRVLVTGINPLISASLKESSEYRKLADQGLIFENTSAALRHLGH